MAGEVQTSSNTNPDAALLSGGPAGDHGKEMPRTGEPHPESVVTKETVKYELNGKTFNSAEDMSKYVADLEQKVISQPQFVPQQTINTAPPKIVIDGLTLDQLMFANPERYHQYMLEQADKRADAKIQTVENRKIFWNDFYTSNPDLRGKEELVDALVAKNWSTWEKMGVKEFAKVVSDSSRAVVRKIGGNATEVRPSEAAALSASGQGAPQIQVPRQSTNFVDEMNIRRMKRQQKAK